MPITLFKRVINIHIINRTIINIDNTPETPAITMPSRAAINAKTTTQTKTNKTVSRRRKSHG